MKTLPLHRINLLAFFVVLFVSEACGGASQWMLPDGKSIKGELEEVIGPYLLVVTSRGPVILSIDSQGEKQWTEVAKFQADQSAPPTSWSDAPRGLARDLKGDLIQLKNGVPEPFDLAARSTPRFLLVYYSARWCGPCHRFSPKLVKAYDKLKSDLGDKIELVFASWDQSRAEQLAYMKEYDMKWPALDFSRRESIAAINRWKGSGIPCLVLMTSKGQAIFHSYEGEEYVGPESVLDKLEALVPYILAPRNVRAAYNFPLAKVWHLEQNKGRDVPPSLYLLPVNKARFGGMKVPDFTLRVRVGADGRITSILDGGTCPSPILRLLEEECAQWMILPALKGGNPVESVLDLNIEWRVLAGS